MLTFNFDGNSLMNRERTCELQLYRCNLVPEAPEAAHLYLYRGCVSIPSNAIPFNGDNFTLFMIFSVEDVNQEEIALFDGKSIPIKAKLLRKAAGLYSLHVGVCVGGYWRWSVSKTDIKCNVHYNLEFRMKRGLFVVFLDNGLQPVCQRQLPDLAIPRGPIKPDEAFCIGSMDSRIALNGTVWTVYLGDDNPFGFDEDLDEPIEITPEYAYAGFYEDLSYHYDQCRTYADYLYFDMSEPDCGALCGTVTPELHRGTQHEEYDGAQGVLQLDHGAMKINEADIPYSDTSFALRIRFQIQVGEHRDMTLLTADHLPAELQLTHRSGDLYDLTASFWVDGHRRCAQSELSITAGRWYMLDLALQDGSFLLLLDGKRAARCVFVGTPYVSAKDLRGQLRLGGSGEKSFSGALDLVVLTNRLYSWFALLEADFDQSGWMETHSKYEDLLICGIDPGALLSRNNLLDEDGANGHGAYYDLYENGAIMWVPGYKTIWMTTPVFEKYMELLKETAVGTPIDSEEPLDNTMSFCTLECGRLYHNLNSGQVYYLNSTFLDAYVGACENNTDCGLPRSGILKKIDTGVSVTYVICQNVYLFLCSPQANDHADRVLILPRELAEYYLENAVKLGEPLDYVQGPDRESSFASSDGITNMMRHRTAQSSYLECSRKTVCFQHIHSEETINGSTAAEDTVEYHQIRAAAYAFLLENNLLSETKWDFGFITGEEKDYYTGVYCQPFSNGVLLWKDDDNFHLLNELRLTLTHVDVGEIDDGLNRIAELYLRFFLKKNGDYVVENERLPQSGSYHSGGDVLRLNAQGQAEYVSYLLHITNDDDSFEIHIKSRDKDSRDKYDDYLGSHTFTLNAATGWGLLADALPNAKKLSWTHDRDYNSSLYGGVCNMHAGEDLESRIHLSFRLSTPQLPVEVRPYVRKNGCWPITNYRALDKISENLYQTVFSAQTGFFLDYIFHCCEAWWFHIIRKSISGKGGQCSGMSLEAMNAIHNRSPYNLALDRWSCMKKDVFHHHAGNSSPSTIDEVDPAFGDLIRQRHMHQGSWAIFHHKADMVLSGIFFYPERGFDQICSLIDRDGYCHVSLNTRKGGHAVVGYKYDSDKIYVADVNHPWWETDPEGTGQYMDGSYITIKQGRLDKARLNWTYSNGETDSKLFPFLYGTSYALIAQPPRAPTGWDIFSIAIEWLIRLLPALCVNLEQFLVMFCDSTASPLDITASGPVMKDLPIGFEDSPSDESSDAEAVGVHMVMGIPGSRLTFKIVGNQSGHYFYQLMGRNRSISIEGDTTAGETDLVEITGIDRGAPVVNIRSETNPNKYFKVENKPIIPKYGKAAAKRQTGNDPEPPPAKPFGAMYYLNRNAQANGDHEIHKEGCSFMPSPGNRISLGRFETDAQACQAARSYYHHVNGCYYCCPDIDTDRKAPDMPDIPFNPFPDIDVTGGGDHR